MPTYDRTRRFDRDYKSLTPEQRAAFRSAVAKFVKDLPSGHFGRGLRVKGIQGADGVFEMTLAGDGRATFQYGPEIEVGEAHVVWRRVGTHQILTGP